MVNFDEFLCVLVWLICVCDGVSGVGKKKDVYCVLEMLFELLVLMFLIVEMNEFN